MTLERATPGAEDWAEPAAPHLAMFNGFLPHAFELLPLYNRFVQQLWRISHRDVDVKPLVVFPEGSVNIVNGFRRRGYATFGVAAMDWFAKPSPLQDGFEWFRVTGTRARAQVEMLREQISRRARRRPCFAFANFGEDPMGDRMSLGRLFNTSGVHDINARDDALWARQVACAEYLDERMEVPLLIFRLNAPPHAAPERRGPRPVARR